MSDSGLEANSSSHEITSEHSNMNFEITEYSSIKDISDEIHTEQICNHEPLLSSNAYCKSFINDACRAKNAIQSVSNNHNKTYLPFANEYQLAATLEDAQKTKMNSNEIFQYENRILSEPLYKTDDIDEDECFEFIKPTFAGNDCHQEISKKCKLEQKIHSDIEKLETTVKVEFDHSHPSNMIGYNSFSASGSYFIDASSLNDEIDVISTNVTKDQYINNSISLPCFSLSSNYINYTVNKSNNGTMEEQSHKFMPLKTPILQTRYERVAEFEQELKFTEYLQLSSELRKVKRMDPVLEEIVNTNKVANKIANKESLTVEIKKIDGEKNAHSSLCSDDTKISSDQDKKIERSSKIKTIGNESKNNSIANENKRSLFIRRNTFELDSNDEKLSILRQEYERRQGTLVFQNAIPQYSGHRVDGDSICHISSGVSPITESLINFASEIQITNVHRPISYLFKDCEYENNQIQTQKNSLQNNLNRSCTIYPITKSASDKLIMNYDKELDDASNCSNSLPVTLDSILNKNDRMKNVKGNRRDETTPIISGGISTSDYFELLDNPIMRHKTECSAIISEDTMIMHNSEIKAESSKMSSSLTTWVIDMSDCNKTKFQNNSQNMSQSFSTSECIKQSIQKPKNHEKRDSLGFFVNLKDVNDVDLGQNNHSSGKKQDNCKSYCKFYIDISDKSDNIQIKPEKQDISIENDSYNESEKKNIFSMFIDLNDSCESNKDIAYGQNFSTVSNKLVDIETANSNSKINNGIMADNFLSKEKEEKTKPSVFMFIESDSPVIKKRILSTSRPTFKRHSWNLDKVQSTNDNCIEKELIFRKGHKRAHSISMDNRSDTKQFPTIDDSNHSLTNMIKTETHNDTNFKILPKHKYDSDNTDLNNINISFDNIFEFEIKTTPPNSHVEIENRELHMNYEEVSDYVKNLRTTEARAFEDQFSKISIWKKAIEEQNDKSETFDISSSSESLDNDNCSYKLSSLLNSTVSDINNKSQIITAANNNKISETCKSLNEAIRKIECELKEPEEYNNTEQIYDCCPENDKISNLNLKILNSDKKNSCNFVRLSDLDIKPTINHTMNVLMVNDDSSICRMNSNIPETSWVENKLVTTRNISIKPISKKLMSTSLPCKQKSPVENLIDEGEGIISESDLSSMQSSMGRSGAGMYTSIYFLESQLIIIIMMILMKMCLFFCIFL